MIQGFSNFFRVVSSDDKASPGVGYPILGKRMEDPSCHVILGERARVARDFTYFPELFRIPESSKITG